jgi:hypothetical protein
MKIRKETRAAIMQLFHSGDLLAANRIIRRLVDGRKIMILGLGDLDWRIEQALNDNGIKSHCICNKNANASVLIAL